MRQIVALVTKYLWAGPTRVLYTLVSLLAALAACEFLIFNFNWKLWRPYGRRCVLFFVNFFNHGR